MSNIDVSAESKPRSLMVRLLLLMVKFFLSLLGSFLLAVLVGFIIEEIDTFFYMARNGIEKRADLDMDFRFAMWGIFLFFVSTLIVWVVTFKFFWEKLKKFFA